MTQKELQQLLDQIVDTETYVNRDYSPPKSYILPNWDMKKLFLSLQKEKDKNINSQYLITSYLNGEDIDNDT